MTHAVDLGLVVNLLTSLAYVALGAWVLTLTPRRGPRLLLAGFALSYGLVFAPGILLEVLHLRESLGVVAVALLAVPSVAAGFLFFALAASVGTPERDHYLMALALAAGFGVQVVQLATIGSGPRPGLPGWLEDLRAFLANGSLAGGFLLLPLRARPGRSGAPDPTQPAILAVAITLFAGGFPASSVAGLGEAAALGDTAQFVGRATPVAVFVGAAGLWLWNMGRVRGATVRVHRAAALGILGLLAAGAVFDAAVPTISLGDPVVLGLRRTLAVGLVAYGVLRHDFAGLDEKVEFGVSKTTVAGVFVAVFFVVSEGAQVLFAGFAGSEILGVLAAGALVFVLSPLQRFADRFAAKAVPGGAEVGAEVEQEYRTFVEGVLADGEVTPDEERRLAEKADDLGLGHARERQIREQVEDETQAGGEEP